MLYLSKSKQFIMERLTGEKMSQDERSGQMQNKDHEDETSWTKEFISYLPLIILILTIFAAVLFINI